MKSTIIFSFSLKNLNGMFNSCRFPTKRDTAAGITFSKYMTCLDLRQQSQSSEHHVSHNPLLQMSFIEEQIDCMDEYLLELSVQRQRSSQTSTQLKGVENSVGHHSAVINWIISHYKFQ